VLALQVELCSPRLIASRVEARWSPSGFRPGFWPQGQSSQSTPLHRLPRVLPDPVRLGRLVEPEPLYALRTKHAWPAIGWRSHATGPPRVCENGRFTPSLARLGIEKSRSR